MIVFILVAAIVLYFAICWFGPIAASIVILASCAIALIIGSSIKGSR